MAEMRVDVWAVEMAGKLVVVTVCLKVEQMVALSAAMLERMLGT